MVLSAGSLSLRGVRGSAKVMSVASVISPRCLWVAAVVPLGDGLTLPIVRMGKGALEL